MTTAVINAKVNEVENEIPDHAKSITTQEFKKLITTQEFNKLTEENFAERLNQANLVRKTDFDI